MAKEIKKDTQSIKSAFSALMTLTAMQLKEKMDVKFLNSFKSTLFKVIFTILEFAAVTAICWLLFFVCRLFGVLDPITKRVYPRNLTAVLAVMMGLSVIFTTGGLVKSLYLSKDNQVLLTFPTTPAIVFLSKLLVYYVYELKKNFLFLIPFFIGYGIFLGYPIYYYFWTIFLFVFFAMIPVLLGALLSMPALYVYQFVKKYKFIQALLVVIALALVVALGLWIISIIPPEINFLKSGIPYIEIYNFTSAIENGFPPIHWLNTLIIGNPYHDIYINGIATATPKLFSITSLWTFLGLIGSLVVLLALGFLLAQPLFYTMASKPFEFAKRMKIEAKENIKAPVLLSAVKKEWLVAIRSGSLISLLIQFVMVLPFALAFLNSLYKAMNISAFGVQMTVAFNFLIVLLFSMSTSVNIASAYSKDGFAAYLNKVQPSTYGSLLFARLTVNMVAGLIGIIASTIVYSLYCVPGSVSLVLFAITSYLIYVAHLFWSAELDVMNPQYTQYATFSEQSNNPNENKSSLLSLVISFLFAICLFLLIPEGAMVAWWKAMFVAMALAGFKIFTFFLKIKVYYKEK